MIISQISVENFRNFKGVKTFDFENKPFIMLTAPNGLGKTTLIDAIEWCLTGNIRRLQRNFELRSTTADEKEINSRGILKNKYCSDTDKVVVKIIFKDDNKELIITRTRTKDELQGSFIEENDSELEISSDSQTAIDWFKNINKKNFYNTHICDVQKAFILQSEKRDKNTDLLADFISNNSDIKVLVQNLKHLKDDIKIKTNAIDKDIEQYEQIILNKRNEENDCLLIENLLAYPQVKYYPDELLDFSGVDIKQIQSQANRMKQFVYAYAANILETRLQTATLYELIDDLNALTVIVKRDGSSITKALEYNIYSDNGEYQRALNKRNSLQSLIIDKHNVFDLSRKIFEPESTYYKNIRKIKYQIGTINEIIETKKAEQAHFTKGNEIIDAFSTLVKQKSVWSKYKSRNNDAKCPVCGSAIFGKMESDELLSEAERYLSACDEKLVEISKTINEYSNTVDMLYEKAIAITNTAKDKIISICDEKIQLIEKLKEKTKDYFDYVSLIKSKLEFSSEVEDFNNIEKLNSLIAKFNNKLNRNTNYLKKHKDFEPLLRKIGYEYNAEPMDIRLLRFRQYSDNLNISDIDISSEQLFNKIIFLDNCINSVKLSEIRETIAINELELNKKKKELREWSTLSKKISKQTSEIEKQLRKLEEEECKAVWPRLEEIYCKLARCQGVNFMNIRREGKSKALSFEDEAEKQVVNILSNGQLCVFLVSFFFASIITRSEVEPFKVYFLDDLTACLDDINMLAFIDLMKYQMKDHNSINQLFFATSDERIRKLIDYKFRKADIDIKPITESLLNINS